MKQQLHQNNIYEQINPGNVKTQMEYALQNANNQLKKVASEIEEIKSFILELEKDRFIDRKKGFIIEWKSTGELYINNVRQLKNVADKYSKYYHRDGYKIRIDDEGNLAPADPI